MLKFLTWWDSHSDKDDGLIRAGLAHFYFVTINPLEDIAIDAIITVFAPKSPLRKKISFQS